MSSLQGNNQATIKVNDNTHVVSSLVLAPSHSLAPLLIQITLFASPDVAQKCSTRLPKLASPSRLLGIF